MFLSYPKCPHKERYHVLVQNITLIIMYVINTGVMNPYTPTQLIDICMSGCYNLKSIILLITPDELLIYLRSLIIIATLIQRTCRLF